MVRLTVVLGSGAGANLVFMAIQHYTTNMETPTKKHETAVNVTIGAHYLDRETRDSFDDSWPHLEPSGVLLNHLLSDKN